MKDQDIIKLLNKLGSENINPKELEKLTDLLRSRKDLSHLLVDMELNYQQLIEKANLLQYRNADLTRERLMQSISEPIAKPEVKPKRFIKSWHYAALLIVVSSIAGMIYMVQQNSTSAEFSWQTVETVAGQKKQLSLADGTQVTLNGNSTLKYADRHKNGLRLVHLEGEALFDVAKDKAHPFIIISKNFTTQVVGTTFNLDTDIESSISVNEGIVNVIAMDAQLVLQDLTLNNKGSHFDLNNWTASLPKDIAKLTLTKGQKAYLKEESSWESLPFSEKSWTSKQIVFFDEPMNQVILKLNRSFGIPVSLSEKLLKNRVTITFENKGYEQILYTLADLCDAKLIKDGNNWKITK